MHLSAEILGCESVIPTMEVSLINISKVIKYLNENYKYDLSDTYYANIEQWRQWWQGLYAPFHTYHEDDGTGTLRSRELYTLKMAKKVCEDWGSLLLNEKTEIVIDDRASQMHIDKLLKELKFWQMANELIEKAFYSGTGAFVLRVNNIALQGETAVASDKTRISIEYIGAMNIIPLSVVNGDITEVAFVSEIIKQGRKYIYLEIHLKTDTGYEITNKYFSHEDKELKEAELPEKIAPIISINCPYPLFGIIKPNIANTIDGNNGLGMAVFNEAVDNLKGVDLAFNNLNRDFKLGGKKVFYNKELLKYGTDGKAVTPDDVMQQLFISMGDNAGLDDKAMIQEYNPKLRVDENTQGIQAQLDYLSFKVGFGTKHYQFHVSSNVTATQYSGDKQEIVQQASKHMIIIEQALISLTHAILWVGKNLQGKALKPDAGVTIKFEDGFVIDEETNKANDKIDVREGLMHRWEYRMKWYGEDEKTAKAAVGSVAPTGFIARGAEGNNTQIM